MVLFGKVEDRNSMSEAKNLNFNISKFSIACGTEIFNAYEIYIKWHFLKVWEHFEKGDLPEKAFELAALCFLFVWEEIIDLFMSNINW